MVVRADTQRRGFPLAQNSPSVGLLVSRLALECQPLQGPLAAGVRLQDCVRLSGPGGAPVELDMALGKVRSNLCGMDASLLLALLFDVLAVLSSIEKAGT